MKHPAEKDAFVASEKGSVVVPEAPEPKTKEASPDEKPEEAAE